MRRDVCASPPVHSRLLRDVRVQLHGVPVGIPAAADGAVSHSRSRRIARSRPACSSVPDVLVGLLGAAHRRVVDRVGQRRVLIIVQHRDHGLLDRYAVISDYRWMLALVLVHGVFWSGLLSASAAYMTNMLPASAARGGHRLLGSVERRGDRGRADRRILDLSGRAGGGSAPDRAVAEHRHGRDRFASARRRSTLSRRSAAVEPRRGVLEWRVLAHLGHAVPLLVRLRRDHQLHRAVRRRQSASTPKSIYLTTLAIVDPADAADVRDGSAIGSATGACSCRAWC